MLTMILINFSHPLSKEQICQIENLTNMTIEEVISIPVQFDNYKPFLPQLEALVAQIPLSAEALQTETIILNLPSLNFITALLLAELHGRMGYFPTILRLRPISNCTPPHYEIAELLNLQDVRDHARKKR